MDREKKVGVILIAIGICIPLAVLPFVSGYSGEKGFVRNLYEVGIVLGGAKQADTVEAGSPAAGKKPHKRLTYGDLLPRKIPFRFILAITPVFVLVGVVRLDRARRRERDDAGPESDRDRLPD